MGPAEAVQGLNFPIASAPLQILHFSQSSQSLTPVILTPGPDNMTMYCTLLYSTVHYCVSMFQRGLAQYMGCCLTAFAHHPKARVILATERYSLIDFILFRYFIICTTHM